jgi:hypothetical protein
LACYSTSGCSVRVEKRLQACGVRVLGGEEGAGVGRAGVRVEKSVQACGIWRAAGLRQREPRRVAAGGGENILCESVFRVSIPYGPHVRCLSGIHGASTGPNSPPSPYPPANGYPPRHPHGGKIVPIPATNGRDTRGYPSPRGKLPS